MARVGHCSLCQLGPEPYSWAIFKWGLKARKAEGDSKENKVLDRAIEYARVVGMELVDMLVSVNLKVEVIAPHMPMQHMFGGDSLQNFIHDHQDWLERLEDQLANLTTMTENVVGRLSIVNKSYHQYQGHSHPKLSVTEGHTMLPDRVIQLHPKMILSCQLDRYHFPRSMN